MIEHSEVFEIMRKSYVDFGDKVFIDKNRLSAYMVDLLVEYPMDRKKLSLAVNENIVSKMISDNGKFDDIRNAMLINELVQIYEIPESVAHYIINVFSYAIYGQKLAPYIEKEVTQTFIQKEPNKSNDGFEEIITLDKYTGNQSVVIVPERVSAIGNEAFKKNTSIKKVILPNTVRSIGSAAFQDSTLEEINIPDGIEYISTEAFSRCKSLTTIKWDSASSLRLYGIGAAAFGRCESLKEISIPEGVKYIMQAAFTRCDELERVSFPNSLSSIDSHAFMWCASLREVTIPKDTHIKEDSFEGCDNIILRVYNDSVALDTAKKAGLKYEIVGNSFEEKSHSFFERFLRN